MVAENLPEEAPPTAAASKWQRYWYVPVLAVWAGVVGVAVAQHEPWFDEAQAWLIARDCPAGTMLSQVLRYEGHPPLWYFVLKAAIWCGLPYRALGLLGATIAAVGVAVLLARSPFPKPLAALLPFTYFLAYQYAAIARSYVLLPLLLAAVAVTARRRWQWPVGWAASALLLAAVSAHTFVMAGGIVFAHVLQLAFRWQKLDRKALQRQIAALSLFAAGALLVLLVDWPAKDCVAITGLNGGIDAATLRNQTLLAIDSAFFDCPPLTVALLAVSCYCFFKTGVLGLFLLAWLPVVGVFVTLRVCEHHHGILFLGWLFVAWCSADAFAAIRRRKAVDRPLQAAWYAMALLMAGLFVRQAIWTACAVAHEVAYPYCGAAALAGYLKAHDLTEYRIDGVQEWIAAVQPYFPANVFANFPSRKGMAFIDWRRSFHATDRAFTADHFLAQPCDVIVWPDPNDLRRSRSIAALAPAMPPDWRLIGYFPGRLIFKDRLTFPHGYGLFVRRRVADQLHLPAVERGSADAGPGAAELPPDAADAPLDQAEVAARVAMGFGNLLRTIDPDAALWEYRSTIRMGRDWPPDKLLSADAIAHWRKLEAAAHTNIGAMLAPAQPGAAAAYFQEALRLDPQDPNICLYYGDVLTRTGQLQAAADVYLKVLAIDPGNPPARRGLGRILQPSAASGPRRSRPAADQPAATAAPRP